MDNNRRLKILAGAIRLSDADIARAATTGGIKVSRHRAQSWMRSPTAEREHQGKQQRRFKAITQEEFDAVLKGLRAVLDEHEGAEPAPVEAGGGRTLEQRIQALESATQEHDERLSQLED